MADGFFFGIDTSNYTTSAAAVTVAGEVFCTKRPLAVAPGERGLRQSDALFCHTRDLGEVVEETLEKLRAAHPSLPLLGVGVSTAPRRVEGSYMPCFLAGVNAARCAAAAAGVPLISVSHQEGHIEAARYGAAEEENPLEADEFLAFHLSGGTTELLRVKKDGPRWEATLAAEVLDLTCGQFIDRCGVKLGLPFPAGAHLEKLAEKAPKRHRVSIAKKENGINLSGLENRFDKMKKEGASPEELAGFVFDAVEEAIRALLDLAGEDLPVLFSGGVSSSHLFKERLAAKNRHFAPPSLCADNAVGVALLARKGVFYGSSTCLDRDPIK